MGQSIRIKTNELTQPLAAALRKNFLATGVKEFIITFSTPETSPDAKKGFLRNETQEETNARIKKSINDTDPNNFVSFTEEEFLALSSALSKNARRKHTRL